MQLGARLSGLRLLDSEWGPLEQRADLQAHPCYLHAPRMSTAPLCSLSSDSDMGPRGPGSGKHCFLYRTFGKCERSAISPCQKGHWHSVPKIRDSISSALSLTVEPTVGGPFQRHYPITGRDTATGQDTASLPYSASSPWSPKIRVYCFKGNAQEWVSSERLPQSAVLSRDT